jgi:DNA-binding CsgD family transcriptional regulator
MPGTLDLAQAARGETLTSPSRAAQRLVGRAAELDVLFGLVDRTSERAGALVVRGGPGIGKTALLQAASRHASENGVLVLSTFGVQSEACLACSGLQRLFIPVLAGLDRLPTGGRSTVPILQDFDRSIADRLEHVPCPQREALETAFGLSTTPAPDRFLLGLAVRSLLADVAKGRRLLCIIDDAQWLDAASMQALAFAARRLSWESMAIVFAIREPSDNPDLIGLAQLPVTGLPQKHARTLLATVIPGRLGGRVRDRILAETHHNPLALLEAARSLTASELAEGFALPDIGSLPVGIEEEQYLQRIGELPNGIGQLMVLAAADPTGDAALILRAAQTLKIRPEIVAQAEDEQLLEIGVYIRFPSPRLRTAVYRMATTAERRAAHAALSMASDPESEPDRRAWHRAQAAAGPNEGIAKDLVRCANRAHRHGDVASEATFLEQAAALTPDPSRRASRALSASEAKFEAGDLQAAEVLLAIADVGPLSQREQAQAQRVQAQMAFESGNTSDAPSLLLRAAQRLETLDTELAQETYLEGFAAATVTGFQHGTDVVTIARAARSAPLGHEPSGATQLLVRGLAIRFTDGYAAAAPTLHAALRAHRSKGSHLDRSCVTYSIVAMELWDDEAWLEFASEQANVARATGRLSLLPRALAHLAANHIQAGELSKAAELLAEAEDFGLESRALQSVQLSLAAWRGQASSASNLAEVVLREEQIRGEGRSNAGSAYAMAVFHNGLGHYELAFEAAQKATTTDIMCTSSWALSELAEAAARSGHQDAARVAVERLSRRTAASGTVWAKGTAARSRALIEDGELAEHLHRQAIESLGQCRMTAHLARARLTYGEWLRRENRRVDARAQLRTAYDMFAAMGADGFANRTQHELLATGAKVRKRQADTRDDLTPQEAQIARLARDGRTNPEIGSELFISPRTVEWHLGKVFMKLGINSRKGLRGPLPELEYVALSA